MNVVEACEGYLANLEERVGRALPVIPRGFVTIDFDKCSVDINGSIKFASRQPPDTSAEIEAGGLKEADEIIGDLATVLSSFGTKMVVEGHTGNTEPVVFWQALADNRSRMLVRLLEAKGVPRGVAVPKGYPGGGAMVLVYPADVKFHKA